MHPAVKVYDIILPVISDFFSLLAFYAIWKKSTSRMKYVRKLLLKMVITDVILTQLFGWGWAIEQYYPIPVATLNGFFKYFGPIGGQISFSAVNIFLIASSMAVYECIAVRLAIAFDINWILHACKGWRFLVWQLLMAFIYAGLTTLLAPANSSLQELWIYALSINATHYLANIDFTKDAVVFMNFNSPKALPFMILGCIALTLYLIIGYFCAFLTHRKLFSKSETFSIETKRLQRSLTIMLVVQTSLPVVFLALPYMILLLISLASPETSKEHLGTWDPHAIGWNWIAGAFMLYPPLNSFLTLVIIKPYRSFFFSLIGHITGPNRVDKVSVHVLNSSVG